MLTTTLKFLDTGASIVYPARPLFPMAFKDMQDARAVGEASDAPFEVEITDEAGERVVAYNPPSKPVEAGQ